MLIQLLSPFSRMKQRSIGERKTVCLSTVFIPDEMYTNTFYILLDETLVIPWYPFSPFWLCKSRLKTIRNHLSNYRKNILLNFRNSRIFPIFQVPEIINIFYKKVYLLFSIAIFINCFINHFNNCKESFQLSLKYLSKFLWIYNNLFIINLQ